MEKLKEKTKLLDSARQIKSNLSPHKNGRPKRLYLLGRTISIILNDDSIEMAAAQKMFSVPQLLDVTKIYLPHTLDSDDRRRDFITVEINRFLKDHKGWVTRYILGIGGSASALRNIALPQMTKKELKNALYWEGNRRIPFGLDDAYYGYHTTKSTSGKGQNSTETILMAVSKTEIDKKLDLLKRLGIHISSVYHELEALGYLLPFIDGYDSQKTYALINVKRKNSEISFYRGTRLEFINISSVGTETLAVADSQTKHEFFTESLVNEISISLDYYIGQFSNTSTDLVFVYGDLAYSEELIHNLSNRFGIVFRRFPLDNIAGAHRINEQIVEQMPVSLSAAALAISDYDFINFLPPIEKEKIRAKKYFKWAVPAVCTLVLFLSGFWWSLKYSNNINEGRLHATEEQINHIKNSSTFILYTQIKNQLAAEKAIIEKLYQEPTFLNLNLKELTRITPTRIKLNLYDIQNLGARNVIILSGEAVSNQPPPEIILAEFIAGMNNSPFFDRVALKKHSKRYEDDHFKIDFTIEMDGTI